MLLRSLNIPHRINTRVMFEVRGKKRVLSLLFNLLYIIIIIIIYPRYVHSEDKETEKIHERINSLLNILSLANNWPGRPVSNNRNES